MTNQCEYAKVCGQNLFLCTHWIEYKPPPFAQAEWLAAQMDERAMEDLEDEDEEGVSFLFKLVEQTP